MDRNRFSERSPGRIVQIPILPSAKDWSFIPDELPPKWEFPADLWPLLADAKEALGRLDGIGQTLPNPELLLRPLQSREAIASSRIEGTYVTPEQLLLYQLDPREPRSADEKMADWAEVFNYGNAFRHGCKLLQSLPVCQRVVKEMHELLMHGVRGQGKSPGQFRRRQVQVGSSGRYIPPPVAEVQRLMDNLETYVNSEDDSYDPLVRAYLVHYQFETIHPFEDGNGRIGRTLLALMTYHWCHHTMPWLYMSAFFDRFREEYVANLFEVSAQAAWTSWIRYCLIGTVSQANDSIRRCRRFNQLRGELPQRVDSHSARTARIIELLFQTPVVSIPTLAQTFGVSYPTAKHDIERLVAASVLKEIPETWPRAYFSPELMSAAYDDPEDAPANADGPPVRETMLPIESEQPS